MKRLQTYGRKDGQTMDSKRSEKLTRAKKPCLRYDACIYLQIYVFLLIIIRHFRIKKNQMHAFWVWPTKTFTDSRGTVVHRVPNFILSVSSCILKSNLSTWWPWIQKAIFKTCIYFSWHPEDATAELYHTLSNFCKNRFTPKLKL